MAEVETEIVVTVREDTEDVMPVRARMVGHQESLRLHCKFKRGSKSISVLLTYSSRGGFGRGRGAAPPS